MRIQRHLAESVGDLSWTHTVALGQACVRGSPFLPVSVIALMLHTYLHLNSVIGRTGEGRFVCVLGGCKVLGDSVASW